MALAAAMTLVTVTYAEEEGAPDEAPKVAARSGDATFTGAITAAAVTRVVGLLYGVIVAVFRADSSSESPRPCSSPARRSSEPQSPAPLLLMLPFVKMIDAWSIVGRAVRIPGDRGRPPPPPPPRPLGGTDSDGIPLHGIGERFPRPARRRWVENTVYAIGKGTRVTGRLHQPVGPAS